MDWDFEQNSQYSNNISFRDSKSYILNPTGSKTSRKKFIGKISFKPLISPFHFGPIRKLRKDTIVDLKKHLDACNLKKTGNKNKLCGRLWAHAICCHNDVFVSEESDDE